MCDFDLGVMKISKSFLDLLNSGIGIGMGIGLDLDSVVHLGSFFSRSIYRAKSLGFRAGCYTRYIIYLV